MTFELVVFLMGVGLVGGAWNAVAGGATLFTFPALMIAGLPPVTANATNYLAMLPSNAAALPAYRRELAGVGGAIWPLLLVSGLGAIVGSVLLLVSGQATFEILIPFLILAATLLFAFGDRLRQMMLDVTKGQSADGMLYAALFAFSIYGGYFGAGLGIILLAIVQIMGFSSFHVANSVKNLLAASFTILSIFVFGLGGIIAWPEALVMMSGSTLGGYLGGRYSRLVNEVYLRAGVIGFGFILTAVYFIRLSGGIH
ncbi:MAG: sulfite exporter TauE/SafE family protein [Rhizobiales bacterium]|nr:sulfite exporter TauE/SafE family protein [Hyphomicrobiales bacterium]